MPTPYTLRQRFPIALTVAAVLCSPVPAPAADLLGFYAGGAVGQADVRASQRDFAFGMTPTHFGLDEHATGWKVLLGVRPISLVGAELEYADFGHPSGLAPFSFGANLGIRTDAHPKATSLSGLLYAPLPVPLLDLYGKVGLSRLRSDVNAEVVCTTTPCPPTIPFARFGLNETTTNFAYGAGARLKFAALAVQLEYERISASGGDPDLLSVGFIWTF